jgi:hypothetical protein
MDLFKTAVALRGIVSPIATVSRLLPLLLLAACGAQPTNGASWAGTTDTLPNGAILVSNPAEGLWSAGQKWRLEEDLRIGVIDGDGPDLFGEVIAVRSDALGRIYVADSQAGEIRVFEVDGRHLRSFGRKGGGPGEFGQISGMDWDPEGNLWVMDVGNSRYSVFDTTGVLLASHRRAGGYYQLPWPGGIDGEGRLYDLNTVSADIAAGERGIIRHDRSVAPVDTFRLPHHEQTSFILADADGRRRMSVTVPFSSSQVWTLTPRGDLWMGVNDRFRLHRIAFSGDTLRVIEKQFTPIPVTPDDRAKAVEPLSWFREQGGRIDLARIPATKPAFSRPFEDEEGNLWVALMDGSGEAISFDVFDPEGRYLGVVRAPVQPMLDPVVRDGAMYMIVRDELEVSYVVRLRIVKGL